MSDRANASPKTDTLLAKAEPISDAGSASGTTHLRKGLGGNPCAMAVRERSENT